MVSTQELNRRLESFPDQCKASGLKVTRQRQAVYHHLAQVDSHPCPEEVYQYIRPELPGISLATVYKILDLFQRNGFVKRVSTGGQVARYDANIAPHHHLVCSQCGDIRDVASGNLPISHTTAPDPAFQVSHLEVLFHGLCADCAAHAN